MEAYQAGVEEKLPLAWTLGFRPFEDHLHAQKPV